MTLWQISDFNTCPNCAQPWGDHTDICPMGEHPSWDNDPEPEMRQAEEDKVYRDLREDEQRGP
jgi:hypothetical protein